MRKTAAICVAKLYDINPELVDDRGFLEMLRVSMTADGFQVTQIWMLCDSLHKH